MIVLLGPPLAEAGHGDRTLVLDVPYVKAQFDSGRRFTTIDLRPVEDYRKGHLPGARSIPQGELATRFGEVPRVDLVVLYCECPITKVEDAYRFLRAQSYRNLSVMAEGFEGWASRGYPIER
jgi:rhodanese-related sulfurtransferase